MTWDGVADIADLDEFADFPKETVIAAGNEICRFCRRTIAEGEFIEEYTFPEGFKGDDGGPKKLHYHLGNGKNCPKSNPIAA